MTEVRHLLEHWLRDIGCYAPIHDHYSIMDFFRIEFGIEIGVRNVHINDYRDRHMMGHPRHMEKTKGVVEIRMTPRAEHLLNLNPRLNDGIICGVPRLYDSNEEVITDFLLMIKNIFPDPSVFEAKKIQQRVEKVKKTKISLDGDLDSMPKEKEPEADPEPISYEEAVRREEIRRFRMEYERQIQTDRNRSIF